MGRAILDKPTNTPNLPSLFPWIFGEQRGAMDLVNFRIPLAASLLLLAPLVAKLGHASSADTIARTVIMEFARGDLREAVARLDPKTLPSDVEAVASQIHDMLGPLGSDLRLNQVHWKGFRSFKRDWQKDEFAYHVIGRQRAALVFVTAEATKGKTLLTRFHCEPAPLDLRDRYPFILSGVSPFHYFFIIATAGVFGIIVTAVILCIRRPVRRKWLWLPFILVGVGSVGLYWMPGGFEWRMVRIRPLHLRLFGVGYVKSPLYDPWMVALSFPIGALLFLYQCRRRDGTSQAAEGADAAKDKPQLSAQSAVEPRS